MTHTYNISGMTCGNCVAKAKSELLKLGDVSEAEVQLSSPQATITMRKHIALPTLQSALQKAGNYTITEADGGVHHNDALHLQEKGTWFDTYKPILLLGAFITGGTLLVELANGRFEWDSWMNNFMATFFLSFSFFKLLDVKAFAESYATYDVVAKRFNGWGYVYPFVELLLGLAFLVRFQPVLTNAVAFVVMSVSIIGVLKAVLGRQKIRCACIGAVFNLPMSTITVIEDAAMIVMSGAMLLIMW